MQRDDVGLFKQRVERDAFKFVGGRALVGEHTAAEGFGDACDLRADCARADNAPTYYFSTKTPSVFMFQDQDGNTQYRVYGSKDRGENAWYPCDETGAVAVDALPVQPASDLSNIAAPQFGAEEPQDVPAFYERGENGVYTVEGEWLKRLCNDINFDDYESLMYFQRVLRERGVIDALEKAGIEEGDTVSVHGIEFDFMY